MMHDDNYDGDYWYKTLVLSMISFSFVCGEVNVS